MYKHAHHPQPKLLFVRHHHQKQYRVLARIFCLTHRVVWECLLYKAKMKSWRTHEISFWKGLAVYFPMKDLVQYILDLVIRSMGWVYNRNERYITIGRSKDKNSVHVNPQKNCVIFVWRALSLVFFISSVCINVITRKGEIEALCAEGISLAEAKMGSCSQILGSGGLLSSTSALS